MFEWLTTVKTTLAKVSSLHEFFEDPGGAKSMTRLLSFIVVFVVCFEAIWVLTVLKVAWIFSMEKLGLVGTVVGGKFGADYIYSIINKKVTGTDTEAENNEKS